MRHFWLLLQTETTSLIDRVPEDVRDRADEIVTTVKDNPQLAAMLAAAGVLTAILFFWGLAKHLVKTAVFGGLLSVGAWIWYFNVQA
ncbi:MAG TPA: hypothetical protein VLD62_11025 [Acidimicrobiia bacterium]|nr:hypothetical protein [Acidimicrobiia bacterium]